MKGAGTGFGPLKKKKKTPRGAHGTGRWYPAALN